MFKFLEYPADVLTVDACIVEEQTDYVVCALRIPRSLIAKNHLFLSALSDATSRKVRAHPGLSIALPRRQARTGWRRRWKQIAMATCTCIAISATLAATQLRSAPKPPETTAHQKLLNPVLKVGERLLFSAQVRRFQLCRQDIDRVIWRGGVVVWRTRESGSGQALTDHPVWRIFPVKLPAGLGPGKDYAIQNTVFSDCGTGSLYVDPQPIFSFQITAG